MSSYKQIDLSVDNARLEKVAQRAKDRGIIIPTFEQMKNPDLIPDDIKKQLKDVGLWDVNPLNLFRITWNNDPVEKGGRCQLYGDSERDYGSRRKNNCTLRKMVPYRCT